MNIRLADGTSINASVVAIFERMGFEPWAKAQRGLAGIKVPAERIEAMLHHATADGQSVYIKRGTDIVRIVACGSATV